MEQHYYQQPKKTRKKLTTFSFLLCLFFLSSLIFVYLSPTVIAANTVGSSAESAATASSYQRKTVVATDGTIFASYNAKTGAETPTGKVFRTSTDHGATWSSSTQIDSGASDQGDFSIAIYPSGSASVNNIIIVYTEADAIKSRLLTFNSGTHTWSVGSEVTAVAAVACVAGTSNGEVNADPTVAINNADKITLNYYRVQSDKGTSCTDNTSSRRIRSKQSTNAGTSWGSSYDMLTAQMNALDYAPIVAVGAGFYSVLGFDRNVYYDTTGAGSWTVGDNVSNSSFDDSLSITSSGSDQVDILYDSGSFSDITYKKYTISTDSVGSTATISSTGNDVGATISVGSSSKRQLYAFYQLYQGSTSRYDVRYKYYDGSSWSSAQTVTNDSTLKNANITSAPTTIGNYLPLIWTLGTSPNFTIKSEVIFSNAEPNATTLSSPANGATVTSTTPNLQMSATDVDSDSLKYKVYVYSGTGNNGTNCTGSAVSGSPWDQNSSGTGWDNGTTAYSSGATAIFTVQTTLTRGNSYCWQAQAKDPSGSNTFGSLSSYRAFTVNAAPAAPTLVYPGASATQISGLPQFELRTSDTDSDYTKYFIQLYDATNCGGSQVGSDIDQSSSQTGWKNQDANSGTAYNTLSSTSNSTIARYHYSGTALTPNHVYSWRAKAIDPGGSNTYGSLSSCSDFTTGSLESIIRGNVIIRGNTIIR